ncbi:MAG: hypothetical protein JRI68_24945 [Deltaproteobacteria bacterium]|nr:hypothetical protein [Deltaproteobacteria bacterium]
MTGNRLTPWTAWLALAAGCSAATDPGVAPQRSISSAAPAVATAAATTAAAAAATGENPGPPPPGATAGSEVPGPTATTPIPTPPPLPEDGRKLWSVPERYEHLIVKVAYPYTEQCPNLRYEGHNGLLSRGAASSAEIARRWRKLAQGTRGVFVLRDSLWSQQDHPYHRAPEALMMPPSWVTAAVADVDAGTAIRPPLAPPLSDDAAWAVIATPEDMFGGFPPSDSLHREAIRALGADPDERRKTEAARASLTSLAADVKAMMAVAGKGPGAVAEAGAERIAASDRRYFGRALRYHRVVPIFVENPNRRELQAEGKGMTVPGRTVPDRLIKLARNAVYHRRLRDGDLAIERYDLSVPAERDRAIEVLETFIPAGAGPGPTLWLWVTGRLDRSGKAGENAVRYLPAFRKRLANAKIESSRLRVVSKPATELPTGADRVKAFRSDSQWYRHRDLPYAVKISTSQLRQLVQAAP